MALSQTGSRIAKPPTSLLDLESKSPFIHDMVSDQRASFFTLLLPLICNILPDDDEITGKSHEGFEMARTG